MKYQKQTKVDFNIIPKNGVTKIEYVLNKSEAKKIFSPKEGSFDLLFKGSVFCTFKNGELQTYQFSI